MESYCVTRDPVSSLRSFAAESSKPAASTKPPAERLKANPNDTNALNDYMMANIRRFMQQMESDSKGAEQLLSEMKGVIDELTDNRTSQTVARAGQVGDSRLRAATRAHTDTSLEELGNRLTGSPGDPSTFAVSVESPTASGWDRPIGADQSRGRLEGREEGAIGQGLSEDRG